jgi:hypothetical protein
VSGRELGPWAAWFAALEVDAFDPGLWEAAAEMVSVSFVQGASGPVFAEGREGRVAPVQVSVAQAFAPQAFSARSPAAEAAV